MAYETSRLADNKLILLYILGKSEMPLTKPQIHNIVLENNLLDYFTLQQCLAELEQSDLLKITESQDRVTMMLSPSGAKALEVFSDRISKSMKSTIDSYISSNRSILRKESQIIADFHKSSENEYIVNLKVIENDIVLIDLKLSVVSSKQAKFICEKWKNSSEKIYGQIMNTLIN